MILDLALAVAFIGLLVLCYFDINSTEAVLKKGTGYEANPVMAWLQKQFPKAWVYIKAGVAALLGVIIVAVFPIQWAITILFILDMIYYVVVQSNYGLNQ